MSAKKLDLGSYKTGTRQTQAKHNKYTSYLENDAEEAASPAEEVISAAEEVTSAPAREKKSAASESERKVKAAENAHSPAPSDKLPKRINMAFSERNYNYIHEQTDVLGLTAAYFVSELIKNTAEADVEKFLDEQPVRVTKDFIRRRKGMPAKRINIRFDGGAYSKMTGSSDKLGITLTQYVNTVISLADTEARR